MREFSSLPQCAVEVRSLKSTVSFSECPADVTPQSSATWQPHTAECMAAGGGGEGGGGGGGGGGGRGGGRGRKGGGGGGGD